MRDVLVIEHVVLTIVLRGERHLDQTKLCEIA
jgi:hypothetical protein